jgi:hypothetical protein
MITTNKKPRWFFYPGWVVLNAMTIVIAWYIAEKLISVIVNAIGGTIQVGGQMRITEDFLFFHVLFPSIGLLTGILQYALLRPYLQHMAWWVAATLLGWLLPFVISSLLSFLIAPGKGLLWIMLGLFLIGASIALPQWWMLRRRVEHASWWLLACGFSWWVIGLLNLFTSEPFAVLLAIALIPTIATSIASWLLLDWSPKHQLKSSPSSH